MIYADLAMVIFAFIMLVAVVAACFMYGSKP